MREYDWNIFYNEHTGRLGCVPVTASNSTQLIGTNISSVRGTQEDAFREIERLEAGEYAWIKATYTKERKKRNKAGAATPTK